MKTPCLNTEPLYVTVSLEPLKPFVDQVELILKEFRRPVAILRALEEEVYGKRISQKYRKLFSFALEKLVEIEEELSLYKIPKVVANRKDDVMTYDQISATVKEVLEQITKDQFLNLCTKFEDNHKAKRFSPKVKLKGFELKKILRDLIFYSVKSKAAEASRLSAILSSEKNYVALQLQTNMCLPDFIVPALKMPLHAARISADSHLYDVHNILQTLGGCLEMFLSLGKGMTTRIKLPLAIANV